MSDYPFKTWVLPVHYLCSYLVPLPLIHDPLLFPHLLTPWPLTGLMSRCRKPTEWMLSMASSIWRPSLRVGETVKVPRDIVLRRSARFLPYRTQTVKQHTHTLYLNPQITLQLKGFKYFKGGTQLCTHTQPKTWPEVPSPHSWSGHCGHRPQSDTHDLYLNQRNINVA